MCYNVQQKATIKELTEQFNAQFKMPALYQPKDIINGFEFPLLPVLKSDSPEVFEFLNWGLIPHWAKTEDIRKHTLNAKLETINEVASFKDITAQRCILPVTGFYEWKWLDSKGKRKEKNGNGGTIRESKKKNTLLFKTKLHFLNWQFIIFFGKTPKVLKN